MIMLTHFQNGSVRYQPDSEFTYGYNPDYALNQYRLAGLMGVAAIEVGRKIIDFEFTDIPGFVSVQPVLIAKSPLNCNN